jgi:hypothetical protein
LPFDSVPLAMVAAVFVRLFAALQAPVPPVTDPQVTFTAFAGTVGQAENVVGALTCRVQVFAVAPPLVLHFTTAPAEPVTTGVPVGSVAVKVMAAGVTDMVGIEVAIGCGLMIAGETRAGA